MSHAQWRVLFTNRVKDGTEYRNNFFIISAQPYYIRKPFKKQVHCTFCLLKSCINECTCVKLTYLWYFPGVFGWKFFMWNFTKQLPPRLSLSFQCTRVLHPLSKKTPYKYRKEITALSQQSTTENEQIWLYILNNMNSIKQDIYLLL